VIAAAQGTAVYVYGVLEPDVPVPPAVETVEHGGLVALVREVSLDEFGEEALPTNLNDREWLERTAQAHEAVLERALGTTTVIPFRMTTVYGAEASLRAFLEERSEALVELLDRFAGKVELGVKVYFSRPETQGEAVETGRGYMLQRQAEQATAREADAFAIGCAQDSHERLAEAAIDARANRAQPSELTGRSEQMLLNGAYLVVRGDTQLEEVARGLEQRYAERGVTYEITGPWPPYNFVPHDLAAA